MIEHEDYGNKMLSSMCSSVPSLNGHQYPIFRRNHLTRIVANIAVIQERSYYLRDGLGSRWNEGRHDIP